MGEGDRGCGIEGREGNAGCGMGSGGWGWGSMGGYIMRYHVMGLGTRTFTSVVDFMLYSVHPSIRRRCIRGTGWV